MKNTLAIIGLFVAIICVGMSCGKDELNSSLDDENLSIDTLDIKIGEAFTSLTGEKLSFEAIIEDSRCPEDVVCIWGGMMTIQMKVKVGNDEETFTLTSDPQKPRLSKDVLGYEVTLIDLLPYPNTTKNIDPSNHYAKVIFKK